MIFSGGDDMPDTLRPRTCRECGRSFPGGPRAWYCPACRRERKQEQARAAKARKREGDTRPLGSLDRCARCGAEYRVQGGLQRYCPACAPLAVAEVDRAQGLAWYAAHRDEINPVRNAARRKGVSVCVVCGAEFPTQGRRVTCGEACDMERRRRQAQEAEARRSEIIPIEDVATRAGVQPQGVWHAARRGRFRLVRTKDGRRGVRLRDVNAWLRKRRMDRHPQMRVCTECGEKFTAWGSSLTCSPDCRADRTARLRLIAQGRRGGNRPGPEYVLAYDAAQYIAAHGGLWRGRGDVPKTDPKVIYHRIWMAQQSTPPKLEMVTSDGHLWVRLADAMAWARGDAAGGNEGAGKQRS